MPDQSPSYQSAPVVGVAGPMLGGVVSRTRLLVLGALALILTANPGEGPSKTLAYFVSTAINAANSISTVTLNITSTPSGSAVFSVSNLVPGDYSVNKVAINNGASGAGGNFTYTMTSAATSSSLLDQNVPANSATSGAALLLVRCTSDAAGLTPAACDSSTQIYVTQVYPAAGAGTQKAITAAQGILTAGSVGPVDSGGATFAVSIGGTKFTGGQLTTANFTMGGPDTVNQAGNPGPDGQFKGLNFGHSDYLATIVYLPTQISSATMQGISSTLTLTWTANQRAGAKQ